MRSKAIGLLASVAAIVAAGAPSDAMMLDEFDTLAPVEQGKVVADAIGRIQAHVSTRRPDPARSACIRKLFLPTARDSMPRGINLLIDDLDEIADDERPGVDVETVIMDLIKRECPSSGEAQEG